MQHLLKHAKDVVLFIPDTIDELRIKQLSDKGRYLPELSEGWPLPFAENDWLFIPLPEELKSINPLNPKEFSISPIKGHPITYAIELLAQKIEEQITSRDFNLVEQSRNGIIGFQPYYEGGISGGALKEAEYNLSIKRYPGQESRELYVIEKKENLGKRRIEQLLSLLVTEGLAAKYLTELVKNAVHKLAIDWQNDSKRVKEFASGTFSMEKVRQDIENILPREYEFSGSFLAVPRPSLHGALLYERQERMKKSWEKLFRETKSHDPYRPYCTAPRSSCLFTNANRFETNFQKFIDVINRY